MIINLKPGFKTQIVFIPTSVKFTGLDKKLFQVYTITGIPELNVKPNTYGGYVEKPNKFINSWLDQKSFVLGNSEIMSGVLIENSTIWNSKISGNITIINSNVVSNSEITGNVNIIESRISNKVKIINDMPGKRAFVIKSKLLGPATYRDCIDIKESIIQSYNHSCITGGIIDRCIFELNGSTLYNVGMLGIMGEYAYVSINNFDLRIYQTFGKPTRYLRFPLDNYVSLNKNSLITFTDNLEIDSDAFIYFFKNEQNGKVYYQISDKEHGTLQQFEKRHIKQKSLLMDSRRFEYIKRVRYQFGIKKENSIINWLNNQLEKYKEKKQLQKEKDFYTF